MNYVCDLMQGIEELSVAITTAGQCNRLNYKKHNELVPFHSNDAFLTP